MATGVTKAEIGSTAPPTAHDVHLEPLPLPPRSATMRLSYPERSTEEEVLAVHGRPFVTIDDNASHPSPSSALEPNALVWADNFYASLKLLESQAEQVSLVYLDPPYCTGFDFQSRAQQHAYSDQLAPAEYVEFMRRRLILLRELLSPYGSLYLHIGHQMLGHVKVLLDEVFGASNFRNLIIRRKCSSKNYTRRQLPNLHDYILFYSKSPNYIWNRPSDQASDAWIAKEYPKQDARGRYKLVPIHAPGIRNGPCGQPWRDMSPPPGKHWQFVPDKLEQLDKSGEMHWSRNGNPRRKVYLEESKGVALTDYWPDYRDAHHQSIPVTGYPTEKNLQLLKTIVAASSNPNDIVLDPFCGSGTTVDAAHQLERRWVGFDASLSAIEASVRRLRTGVSKMGDYVVREQAPGSPSSSAGQETPEQPVRKISKFTLHCDSGFFVEHRDEVERIARINRRFQPASIASRHHLISTGS
jgi:adenine-specific DNA-methyltransferase